MSTFHERWMELAAAARSADAPAGEPARPAPIRRDYRSERRSLLALACLLLCLLPWQAELGPLLESASAELAALPSRIPRPPRLPDLRPLLDLRTLASEKLP